VYLLVFQNVTKKSWFGLFLAEKAKNASERQDGSKGLPGPFKNQEKDELRAENAKLQGA
jgi:hypothetical protein